MRVVHLIRCWICWIWLRFHSNGSGIDLAVNSAGNLPTLANYFLLISTKVSLRLVFTVSFTLHWPDPAWTFCLWKCCNDARHRFENHVIRFWIVSALLTCSNWMVEAEDTWWKPAGKAPPMPQQSCMSFPVGVVLEGTSVTGRGLRLRFHATAKEGTLVTTRLSRKNTNSIHRQQKLNRYG